MVDNPSRSDLEYYWDQNLQRAHLYSQDLVESGYAVSLEKTTGIFQENINVLVAVTPEYIKVVRERIENAK